jgi:AcrR family transcriptional regulator
MTTSDEPPNGNDSRFYRQLAEILDHATEVFADKGYEGASMRELSEKSGKSLAGLYYYFESKEKLLYLIQQHTFSTIVGRLRERLAASQDAQERIRIFVHNHIDFATAKPKAMKVLAHEDDVLKGDDGAVLAGIKREYYKICMGLVEDLARAKGRSRGGLSESGKNHISARTAAMGLFGMINWTYTWYRPRVDPDAAVMAREISDIFLQGVKGKLGPPTSSSGPGTKASGGAGAPRTNKKGQA